MILDFVSGRIANTTCSRIIWGLESLDSRLTISVAATIFLGENMSYCRFSSMDFTCDIYAYESNEGYVIHVAANRVVGDIPKTPNIFTTPIEEYQKLYKAQLDFLETAEREYIDHPAAQQTFVLDTLEAFGDKLLELKKEGFIFPEHVFVQIENEILERDFPELFRNVPKV